MIKSENVNGKRPAVSPCEAGAVYVSDGSYEISIAENALNAVIALCLLPAGCIPVDFTIISDDLDSAGPAIVVSGGGIAANEASVDKAMIVASTVAQGGGVARATAFPIVAPLATDLLFGIQITTGATAAAGGTIRGILTYRAEEYGG